MNKTEIVQRINSIKAELEPVRNHIRGCIHELAKLEQLLNEVQLNYENPELDKISKIVCDYFQTTIEEIRQPRRDDIYKLIRQMIINFIKEVHGRKYTTTIIARYLCLISHATVLNAQKRFDEYYATDQHYRNTADKIEDLLIAENLLVKLK